MLPYFCSIIDHGRRQNVVRKSVTHSPEGSCATFLFLPHFDVICDQLETLHNRTAGRLRTAERRENVAQDRECTNSCATAFFRHSAVLSLAALLLRTVSITEQTHNNMESVCCIQ